MLVSLACFSLIRKYLSAVQYSMYSIISFLEPSSFSSISACVTFSLSASSDNEFASGSVLITSASWEMLWEGSSNLVTASKSHSVSIAFLSSASVFSTGDETWSFDSSTGKYSLAESDGSIS